MKLKLVKKQRATFVKAIISDIAGRKGATLSMLPLWRAGYSTTQIVYHSIQPGTTGNYFPDIDRYRFTLGTNRNVWPILHDKLIFDAFMKDRLPIAAASGCFIDGQYIALAEPCDIIVLLREGRVFYVKPAQGGKGIGIMRLSADSDQIHLGEHCALFKDADRLWQGLDHHIVVPFLQQHPTLESLYPQSTNTLRLTVFKNKGCPAALFSPLLRVGTAGSAPLDNFSRGGMLCEIEPETGVSLRACYRGGDGRQHFIDRHPDTGAPLANIQIPFWHEIKKTLLHFHDRYPCFDFVGWDILIGPSGWYVIEGNHNPDLDLPFSFTDRSKEPTLDAFMRNLYWGRC